MSMIISILFIWFICGTFILCEYFEKRNEFFDEDHIYMADIFIGIICLPVIILVGFVVFLLKISNIKIK